MKQIKIGKIVVKENIRKDYGDLTELAASIKENGIRQPLELNSLGELVDGYRRLKAAKAAGLTEVPYFVNRYDVGDITEQLIAGIFQKNLNPIEEGAAFNEYLKNNNIDSKKLAATLGKSESYIQKRLALQNLPEDAKKAVISKKIQLGHALLLAKMPKNQATSFLKEIERQDYSVAAAKAGLEYHNNSKMLSQAHFNTDNCKKCKANGSVQSELFETGKTLNGKCLNPGCFNKKTADFVRIKKAEYQDVIFKGEDNYSRPVGFVDGSDNYDCNEAKITPAYKKKLRKERNKETYLVKVRDDGKVVEFFKEPKSKAEPGDEKQKAASRSNKLKDKISIYRREETIKISKKKLLIGLDLKALVLWHLRKEFNVIGNPYYKENVKKLFESDGPVLEKETKEMALEIFDEMNNECLNVAADKIGLNWKKDFVMTEEYLANYTKATMIKLAKELKIDVSDCKKNKDFKDTIIKNWKKGQVPKILGV